MFEKLVEMDTIKYYSTNLKSPKVTFSEALLKGIAPDGGLYMPDTLPNISLDDIKGLKGDEYYKTAFFILNRFIGNEIDENKLKQICQDSYDFEVLVEKVTGNKYILRLDRGPTASFKDFAARLMSRLMQHYLSESDRHLTILTATSGDTGSAVASAFHGLKNVDVIILYPEKEVTEIQRRQMTTLGGNIRVLAINGKFDDCQSLVKMAFADQEFENYDLSSANSINIGRLLPQSVYYFHSWAQLASNGNEKIVYSVPSGNFGNVMGGLLALKMGLPIHKFIIATNENDEVPEYFKKGIYEPVHPSVNCISSAMNVGHPSNLARLVSLYNGIMNEKGLITKEPETSMMKKDIFAVSITDNETRGTLKQFFDENKIFIEPHGAVAWRGIERFTESYSSYIDEGEIFIALETAHPAKFSDEIFKIIGKEPAIPDTLKILNNLPENITYLENDYLEFKHFLKKIKN